MVTKIKNQPPSTEIRAKLKATGDPVLVAFSGGKDAIATNLALRDAGIPTHLAYLYYIPGQTPGTTLQFVENSLAALEDSFQQRIHRYPHPSFWRWLNNFVFQPPERLAIIEAAQMPTPTYDQMWNMIRDDLGLDKQTYVADGVRAADSIVRRASLSKHGCIKPTSRKVSPIADWLQGEVYQRIADAGIALPIDYEWFGRSFDGIDYRFLKPIKDHAPKDYEQILHWFPLADMELARKEIA